MILPDRGQWYLNTALPTTCGGRIIRYELNLDDTNFTLTGDIAIAMWEVDGTMNIHKGGPKLTLMYSFPRMDNEKLYILY